MNKNKLIKKLTATLGACCLCAGLLSSPVATIPVHAQAPADEVEIMPMSDAILWVYKISDGKLYKRLYNHTKGYWIGEWIYVRDWTEN